jgi:hypothetical protein
MWLFILSPSRHLHVQVNRSGVAAAGAEDGQKQSEQRRRAAADDVQGGVMGESTCEGAADLVGG